MEKIDVDAAVPGGCLPVDVAPLIAGLELANVGELEPCARSSRDEAAEPGPERVRPEQ